MLGALTLSALPARGERCGGNRREGDLNVQETPTICQVIRWRSRNPGNVQISHKRCAADSKLNVGRKSRNTSEMMLRGQITFPRQSST